jgi:cation diffusion facilitator family transporter
MSEHAHDTSHIVQSLVTNLVIAVGKGICAAITGSGALLAETLHSFADCGNQMLLLIGVKRSQLPPDEQHPMGYGRAAYFWSFMVALLLFTGGGVFSIYEGIHKFGEHAEEGSTSGFLLGLGMLAFAFLLEGWATLSNVLEMNRRRGKKAFFRYLRESKDSDLIVVFGENSAAVLGLAIAMVAVGLSHVTHDARWDAGGTIAIGLVLVGVAVFLAVEIKALLVGEAADPVVHHSVDEIIAAMPEITRKLRVITLQQGPGEIMVMAKLEFKADLTCPAIASTINEFERRLREKHPEARWTFVEPDLHGAPSAVAQTA